MKRPMKKAKASSGTNRRRRSRRLPPKDAKLIRQLTKRLRWWAVMLDRATH